MVILVSRENHKIPSGIFYQIITKYTSLPLFYPKILCILQSILISTTLLTIAEFSTYCYVHICQKRKGYEWLKK